MRVFRIIIQSVDHGDYQADNEDEALLTCVPDQDRAAQMLGLSVDQWRRDQVQIIEQLKPVNEGSSHGRVAAVFHQDGPAPEPSLLGTTA